MTTHLSREQLLGHVVIGPAYAEPEDEPLADDDVAPRAWPAVSPWLLVSGALLGVVAALVLWYVMPVEAARAGIWQPPAALVPTQVVTVSALPAPVPDVSGPLWVRCDLTWTAYTSYAVLHAEVFDAVPDWAGHCAVDAGWGPTEQDEWQRRHP